MSFKQWRHGFRLKAVLPLAEWLVKVPHHLHDTGPGPLRWRHMNVMQSQNPGHSTVCLTAYVDPHQRNIKVRITGPLWGEFTAQSPVTRRKLPFDDVIMRCSISWPVSTVMSFVSSDCLMLTSSWVTELNTDIWHIKWTSPNHNRGYIGAKYIHKQVWF